MVILYLFKLIKDKLDHNKALREIQNFINSKKNSIIEEQES